LANLKKLNLQNVSISDKGVQLLPVSIEKLFLDGFDLSTPRLSLMNLKELSLNWMYITNNIIQLLPLSLEKFCTEGVSGCDLLSFQRLSSMTNLKEFAIDDCFFNNEDNNHLVRLIPLGLEKLSLGCFKKLENHSCEHIARMVNLKELFISPYTEISDVGMQLLTKREGLIFDVDKRELHVEGKTILQEI
jgi:hypothetical protein